MVELWYNMAYGDDEPEYYIYHDHQKVGHIYSIANDGYISEIVVYTKYQNHGYGRQALVELMKVAGLHKYCLDVYKYNDQAKRCYEKVGFKLCPAHHHCKKDYYGMEITVD